MSIDSFEKRDIIEMLTEDGLDLRQNYGDREYYTCLCPFHDDRNPSFVVYPDIQRWTCWSCKPGWHDIIDYFRVKHGWDFVTARDFASTPLTDDEMLERHLKTQQLEGTIDMLHLTNRMHNLVELLGVYEARVVFQRIDQLLSQDRWIEAERLLRENGV